MGHNAFKEIVVVSKNSKDVTLTIEGRLLWKNEKGDICVEHDYREKGNVCPAYGTYDDNDIYIDYCNAMMDKIPELEKKLGKINKAIERASKIGVMCERKVLTEKTIKV